MSIYTEILQSLEEYTGKIKPEIKIKWLEALRSGQFIQGKKVLHRIKKENPQNSYCCLGVLCAINNVPEHFVESSISTDFIFDEKTNSTSIPKDFLRKHFLEDTTVPDTLCEKFACLANLNDEGYTFEQIADMIEQYF